MAHCTVMPFRVTVVLIALALLGGCGTRTESPLERAGSLFANAEFNQALQVCDDALAVTDDPQELAELQQLRGRCFIEQAHRLQLGNHAEAAEAKLNEAIDALTHSLESAEGPKALYLRGMAYQMLGDEQRSLADERRAHEIDPEYQTAWTNEPQEEPLDLDLSSQRLDVDEVESASTSQQSSDASAIAASEEDSQKSLFGAEEEDEIAADATAATRASDPSQTTATNSNSANRRNASSGKAPEYRGQPASPGSLSIAGSRSEFGRAPWQPGQLTTDKTSEPKDGEGTEDGDSEPNVEERDGADPNSSETPTDSDDEPSSPEPTRPRPNVIWSPAIVPWSSTAPSVGPAAPPTTGIGGGYTGSPPPFSPIVTPTAPTTGLGGGPLRTPWQNLGGGPAANPFAPPTPFGPGTPLPQSGLANPPTMPQAPTPRGMPGPTGWPQQPVGTPLPPTFGPGLTPQSMPSTGVQRTVSPFQQ